jgi:ABC-type phosphate/phosphonate transport system substrate-binding protein
MKKAYLLALAAILLAGAGCTASSNVDVDDAGVDVNGGIDLNEGSNSY